MKLMIIRGLVMGNGMDRELKPHGMTVREWLSVAENSLTPSGGDAFAAFVLDMENERVRSCKAMADSAIYYMAGVVAEEFSDEELEKLYAQYVLMVSTQ